MTLQLLIRSIVLCVVSSCSFNLILEIKPATTELESQEELELESLTVGFLPSLSNVFLLNGPSMVTTPVEPPNVQLQAPVGLERQNIAICT